MIQETALKRRPDHYNLVFDEVRDNGYHGFPHPLSLLAAKKLHAAVHSVRQFGKILFVTEEAFFANPIYRGVVLDDQGRTKMKRNTVNKA